MTTQFSIDGIISIGLTILMIAWGIDLGVGATLALGGVVFALTQDLGVPLAALLGILAGAGVGIVNGFVVTKMRVNFFIATLSTMVVVKGLTFIITDETTIYGHAESFGWMGSARLGILEFPALAFFGIGIIAHLIMTQTSLGTYWYAIGAIRTHRTAPASTSSFCLRWPSWWPASAAVSPACCWLPVP